MDILQRVNFKQFLYIMTYSDMQFHRRDGKISKYSFKIDKGVLQLQILKYAPLSLLRTHVYFPMENFHLLWEFSAIRRERKKAMAGTWIGLQSSSKRGLSRYTVDYGATVNI